MRHRHAAGVALALLLSCTSTTAWSRDLRIATWNLGWHLARAEAERWIERCGGNFRFNQASGRWEPAATGTRGWDLKWGRDAAIEWDITALPPCDVFQARGTVVPVTTASYAKRGEQIASLLQGKVAPDVIAFQEVSGAEAVRDVLPNRGADYHVCSFEGFKVQRLAFAWRRGLGEAAEVCSPFAPLSLPEVAPQDRARPGLSLGLRIEGQLVRFLTVHLKSSCVSPLEAGGGPNGRGALAGDDQACQILQRQLRPLEEWLEERSAGADRTILLGDFNRNLWHELGGAGGQPVRTDGSEPTGPLGQGVKARQLMGEVIDGTPEKSRLTLLREACDGPAAVVALCDKAKGATIPREEMRVLTDAKGLGCRNPIGLDHILLGPGLAAPDARKIPLGLFGRTLPTSADKPDPILAVSDHCPLVAAVRL